jgi:hypothetical protein
MTNSTIDGMGGDEVNQNFTNTDTLSGTNLYITTLGIVKNLSVTGSHSVTGKVTGTVISITGSIVANSKTLSAASTGSPAAYAKHIQAGSNVTGAGSSVWVSYGYAHGSTPIVTLTPKDLTSGLGVGSIGTGSFIVYSEGAAQVFNWMSIG